MHRVTDFQRRARFTTQNPYSLVEREVCQNVIFLINSGRCCQVTRITKNHNERSRRATCYIRAMYF